MTDMDPAMYRGEIERVKSERDVLRGQLSALRASDEYAAWARAVAERDALRERIAAAEEACDAVEQDHYGVSCAWIRAALDGNLDWRRI